MMSSQPGKTNISVKNRYLYRKRLTLKKVFLQDSLQIIQLSLIVLVVTSISYRRGGGGGGIGFFLFYGFDHFLGQFFGFCTQNLRFWYPLWFLVFI